MSFRAGECNCNSRKFAREKIRIKKEGRPLQIEKIEDRRGRRRNQERKRKENKVSPERDRP